MELKQDKSQAMAKALLNDIGIDTPNESQIATVTGLDDYALRQKKKKKLLAEGKTSGQIARCTGMKANTVKSMIRKIKGSK